MTCLHKISKEEWTELKKLLNEPNPPVELALSPQMYEAFNKAVLEDIERIKGHKVRFSKKNRG
jgi:hypothetical protein